jgi:hypothetical protein
VLTIGGGCPSTPEQATPTLLFSRLYLIALRNFEWGDLDLFKQHHDIIGRVEIYQFSHATRYAFIIIEFNMRENIHLYSPSTRVLCLSIPALGLCFRENYDNVFETSLDALDDTVDNEMLRTRKPIFPATMPTKLPLEQL